MVLYSVIVDYDFYIYSGIVTCTCITFYRAKKGKQHFMKVIKTNKYTVVLYTYVIEYFDKEYEYE